MNDLTLFKIEDYLHSFREAGEHLACMNACEGAAGNYK